MTRRRRKQRLVLEVEKVVTEKKEIVKAGKIFKETAELVLRTEYPEMAIEQREKLTNEADFARLDAFTEAGEYFTVAIEALKNELDSLGIYLPSAIEEAVFYSEEPDADLAGKLGFCDFTYFVDNGEKSAIILEIIRAIHDHWVARSTDEFFREAEKFYCFMPLELVGFERVKYFHEAFVEPVLSLLHLSVDSICIERAYNDLQEAFITQEGIWDEDALYETISDLDYCCLSPSIVTVLESDGGIVEDIISQIITRNEILQF